MMEDGEIGLLGQSVEAIARSQDIENVTIQLLQMEDLIVKETIGMKKFAVEEDVKLMEVGEVGLLGQVVKVIVRSQDPEAAIIQLLQMEDLIVRVK